MQTFTINRRKLLTSGAALASTSIAFATIPVGMKSAEAASPVCIGASCHHDHAYQISALMISLGSPVLSREQKGELVMKAACPTCGVSLAADLTAQYACAETHSFNA